MAWAGAVRLRALLREENQRQLAKSLHMDPSTLNKYASGARSPDPDTLAKLCQALRVSADFLLGLDKASPRAVAKESAGKLPDQKKIEAVIDAKVADLKQSVVMEKIDARLRSIERQVTELLEAEKSSRGKRA